MNIDLHSHSFYSDGVYSPVQVVNMAVNNGCKMLALTDHDTIGGLEEAKMAAQQFDLNLINGVEISVSWYGRTFHIVSLNFDEKNEELIYLIDVIRSARLKRLELFAEKFSKLGIMGVYEGTLALVEHPESVGRAHIAKYLLASGYIKNIQQAFSKYIGEGKSAYVHIEWGNLFEVVSAIEKAGGIAVLAHPLRYHLTLTKLRLFLNDFVAAGGKGIEVGCLNQSKNDTITASLLAKQFSLYASSGSDFHGHELDGKSVGVTPDLPRECQPIWQLFS